jgi:ABC-type molybdate transport system substrate-binding protein
VKRLLSMVALASLTAAHAQDDALVVYAAGSLRPALTEIATAFEKIGGSKVRLVFGASGLLLERIKDKGERADVFASANMEHPQALAAAGQAGALRAFARNTLCALASSTLADITTDTLIDRMLDPAVKLGTSTPKADPSGDYTWAMFERVERQPGRAGAYKTLAAKALQLTGGPASPAPPTDRNVYGALVEQGKADLFITYCTNARIASAEVPTLRTIALPEAINVGASYGVTDVRGARRDAPAFIEFMLAPPAQATFARLGFAAP